MPPLDLVTSGRCASPPRPAVMVARALCRRCPACGSRGIFSGWMRMRPACPGCQHVFAREDGFGLGSILVNLALVEVVMVALTLVPAMVLLDADPQADLRPLMVAGLGAAVVGPLLFLPFARTLWVTFELMLRPATAREPNDRA